MRKPSLRWLAQKIAFCLRQNKGWERMPKEVFDECQRSAKASGVTTRGGLESLLSMQLRELRERESS